MNERPEPFPELRAAHIGLLVADAKRSADFYVRVLNAKPLNRPAFKGPGYWLLVGNIQLHLIQASTPEDAMIEASHPQGHFVGGTNHLAFHVDCYEAMERWLLQLGIPFKRAYIPAGLREAKMPRQLFFQDPDGHFLEICECGVVDKFALGPRPTPAQEKAAARMYIGGSQPTAGGFVLLVIALMTWRQFATVAHTTSLHVATLEGARTAFLLLSSYEKKRKARRAQAIASPSSSPLLLSSPSPSPSPSPSHSLSPSLSPTLSPLISATSSPMPTSSAATTPSSLSASSATSTSSSSSSSLSSSPASPLFALASPPVSAKEDGEEAEAEEEEPTISATTLGKVLEKLASPTPLYSTPFRHDSFPPLSAASSLSSPAASDATSALLPAASGAVDLNASTSLQASPSALRSSMRSSLIHTPFRREDFCTEIARFTSNSCRMTQIEFSMLVDHELCSPSWQQDLELAFRFIASQQPDGSFSILFADYFLALTKIAIHLSDEELRASYSIFQPPDSTVGVSFRQFLTLLPCGESPSHPPS